MEICRCAEYKRITENFKFFTVGTMHYLEERLDVPPHHCLKWVPNKIEWSSNRFERPIIVRQAGAPVPEAPKLEDSDTKWIPVLSGLISQKIVNEMETINTLLV